MCWSLAVLTEWWNSDDLDEYRPIERHKAQSMHSSSRQPICSLSAIKSVCRTMQVPGSVLNAHFQQNRWGWIIAQSTTRTCIASCVIQSEIDIISLPVNRFRTMLSIWKVNCKKVSIFFLVGDVLPEEVRAVSMGRAFGVTFVERVCRFDDRSTVMWRHSNRKGSRNTIRNSAHSGPQF